MEYVAKERRELIEEAIDGLLAIQQRQTLSPLLQAALNALRAIEARTRRQRDAVIPYKAIARPVAVAQAAMEAARCAQ